MKRYITLMFLTLMVGVAMAQPAKKTLVKTFALEGTTTELMVDVKGDVEFEYWDQPTMRIVTEIEANVPEHILKALVAAGRYDYQVVQYNPQANLVAPNQDRQVVIGGTDLQDQWTLRIYLPRNVAGALLIDQPAL